MSNQTLIKASCVVGGILGLGFLAYFVLKKDEKETEQNQADNVLKKKPLTSIKKKPQMNVVREEKPTLEPISSEKILSAEVQLDDLLDQVEEPLHLEVSNELAEPVLIKEKEILKEQDQPIRFGDEFPLRLGSTGNHVERLQVWLMRNYGLFGSINQTFDKKTLAMVQKHLKADQVDERTFNKFKMGKHVTQQIIVR